MHLNSNTPPPPFEFLFPFYSLEETGKRGSSREGGAGRRRRRFFRRPEVLSAVARGAGRAPGFPAASRGGRLEPAVSRGTGEEKPGARPKARVSCKASTNSADFKGVGEMKTV